MKNAGAEIVYTPPRLEQVPVQYRGAAGPRNRAGDRLDRSPLRCAIYAPRVKAILLPPVAIKPSQFYVYDYGERVMREAYIRLILREFLFCSLFLEDGTEVLRRRS